MRLRRCHSLAVLLLLAASGASAGVQITMDTKTVETGKDSTTTMYLGPDRVRIDTADHVMLYQTGQNKMLVLDPKNHTYMDVSAAMSQMHDMMQQRLAGMPEAQRKQIEAAMAQHGMPGAPKPGAGPQLTYQKTGSAVIGSWPCTIYHEQHGDALSTDNCIAPITELGISEADLGGLKAMSASMQDKIPGGAALQMDLDSQTKAIGFLGVPIHSVMTMPDKTTHESTMKSIEHRDLPDSLFEIPAGYTAKPMGGPPPAAGAP
jgi:hypothetical protein